MGVESALINEKISSELGEEGLRGLLACLWPVAPLTELTTMF